MESTQKKAERRKKKNNEIKRKMANMTKEQVQAAISKKRECNAKAMKVVERLIEPNVEQEWLVENLTHINQSHFQDAVEERAIVKYCGYPLCDRSLADVPSKQYHISTKQNKVFDITDRKNYCSNICYRSGIHLKDQLYTSPLWLRDCEDPVKYDLLKPNSGSVGAEVDIGVQSSLKHDKITKKVEISKKSDLPTQANDEKVINEAVKNLNIEGNKDEGVKNDEKSEKVILKIEENVKNEEKKEEVILKIEKDQEMSGKQGKKKGFDMPDLNIPKKSVKNDILKEKIEPQVHPSVKVEEIFLSWVTVDTLKFLFGEEKVKQMFFEFGEPLSENDFNPTLKNSYIYEKYTEICRKLNILELQDKKPELPSKPLPDYEALKKDAEKIEIKVKNFFKGDKISFNEEKEEKDENETKEDQVPPILPLIEKHSIIKTRIRILTEKINKILPDIQSALSLSQFNLRKDAQEFIITLNLTANNVTMKPAEWNLMCILLLRLFSLQNEYLSYAYAMPTTQRRIINLLLAYNLDLNYLERQLVNMTNLEQIIKNSC